MAAELRPGGRQTTPPERAEELPQLKREKQRDFFTGLRRKEEGRPVPAGRCGYTAGLISFYRGLLYASAPGRGFLSHTRWAAGLYIRAGGKPKGDEGVAG